MQVSTVPRRPNPYNYKSTEADFLPSQVHGLSGAIDDKEVKAGVV